MITANEAKNANWPCAAIAIFILLVRLVATRYRDKKFDIASGFVVASILVLVARSVTVHLYLLYGTTNDALHNKSHYFNEHDLNDLKKGSIIALVARLLVTTFYWLQVCLLLLFYSKLLRDLQLNVVAIKACWALIVLTYIAVALATFLECRPFHLYWQIHPDPGQCVKAYGQIFTQGLANIVLDLTLLFISLPMLRVKNRSWNEKLRIGTLFVLGFFCIIIVCLRLAYVYKAGYQPVRSLWATIQMLVSTFVANAPSVYGSCRVVRRRRCEQDNRRASRPESCAYSIESPVHSRAASVQDMLQIRGTPWDKADEAVWCQHVP